MTFLFSIDIVNSLTEHLSIFGHNNLDTCISYEGENRYCDREVVLLYVQQWSCQVTCQAN